MDKFPLAKQIEYLRLLITKEEENYQKAIKSNLDHSDIESINTDIRLLNEYLHVLLEEQYNCN